MRHLLRTIPLSLLGILAFVAPALAQVRPPAAPVLLAPIELALPDRSHKPQQGETDFADLRMLLEGKFPDKGKIPPIDPTVLRDLLERMGKQGQENPDQADFRDMIKGNERFRDPDFLNMLEGLKNRPGLEDNLKQKLGDGGQDPNVVDKVPNLKDNLDNFVDQAKKDNQNPKNKGVDGKLNADADPVPQSDPNARPPLDPAAKEWIEWMQKNFGDSPAGQQAIKELTESLGKAEFKGMFDDMPEFKNGEWKQFDEWGKGALGDNWKMRPPDWNLGGPGGMSPPKIGGGGWNIGGGPTLSNPGVGGAEAAGGGLSVVAVVIGAVGALVLGYILFTKWKRDQEAKQAMMAVAARQGLDLSHIRTRQELVEAFDALAVEKCGDESKNWNHRVVTETLIEAQPAVAAPAQELGDLYQKARYAPPQDDMTGGEFTAAERDLRAVAGGNP